MNEEYENIPEKDARIINNFSTNIKNNLDKAILELQSLQKSLEIYKESINDYITLSVQKNDIVAKYSKANTGGAYNLPAVFASSAGSYDPNAMKADSEKEADIIRTLNSVESQKDSSVKFLVRNQADLTTYIKNVIKLNGELDTYLELLSQNCSWESNKSIKK